MPAAACQRRPQPHLTALIHRSILSLRRRRRSSRLPFSTFSDADVIPTHQINLFHTHIAHLFHSLLPPAASDDDLLSLPWLRRLLDRFLSCLHHFEPLLVAIAGSTSDDRFISDALDLGVKGLDLCNAVSDAADSLMALRRRARIASSALSRGQLRRARRALAGSGTDAGLGKHIWSAAVKLHAMAAGLAAPPSWDEAGDAVAMAMHGMATVVVFVMWVLVVAIVPGGAGKPVQLPKPPPELPWAAAAAAVQERIGEEWRRRGKDDGGGGGGRVGMMVELRKMEWCTAAAAMPEPAAVAVKVEEVCRVLEEELEPFQNRVRDVFHGIVRCRTAVVDSFEVAVRER